MFKAIRVSSDYRVVLVQEADALGRVGPGKGQVRIRRTGHQPTDGWEAPSEAAALGYFSGIGDGLGFGQQPEQPLETLEAATLWMDRAALQEDIRFREELLRPPVNPESAAALSKELERLRAKLIALDAAHP